MGAASWAAASARPPGYRKHRRPRYNSRASASLGQVPETVATSALPRLLLLPAGAPGRAPCLGGASLITLSWPVVGRGPFPASRGWAFRISALGGPGMCLQPCRNAAGLVGKSSFLAFHCSLLVSGKLGTGGEKQRRRVPVEEY